MPINLLQTSQPLVIDACSLINLAASDCLEDILIDSNSSCLVPSIVYNESQFLYSDREKNGSRERIPLDLGNLVRKNLLVLSEIATDSEADTYINLAVNFMDDGEAMAVAMAIHRDGVLITDERIATRYANQHGILVASSLDLLHEWVVARACPDEDVAVFLARIRARARYVPSRRHPLYSWWSRFVTD